MHAENGRAHTHTLLQLRHIARVDRLGQSNARRKQSRTLVAAVAAVSRRGVVGIRAGNRNICARFLQSICARFLQRIRARFLRLLFGIQRGNICGLLRIVEQASDGWRGGERLSGGDGGGEVG